MVRHVGALIFSELAYELILALGRKCGTQQS